MNRSSETLSESRVGDLVLPVIEEQLSVSRRQVETGRVRINKIVEEREETVDKPLIRDEVAVERVPVNRFVKRAVPPRYEGETLVIPLFEERLVVEKRLVLKEELRVTRRRRAVPNRQTVMLRGERVNVERSEPDSPADGGTSSRNG